MLAWPSFCGHHFLGLAANSALRVPIFKQILRSMGVIDASRASARKALEAWPHTIGISTGGVAEVFETNAEDECILLRERVGVVKLAIRTGASLVPCYILRKHQAPLLLGGRWDSIRTNVAVKSIAENWLCLDIFSRTIRFAHSPANSIAFYHRQANSNVSCKVRRTVHGTDPINSGPVDYGYARAV